MSPSTVRRTSGIAFGIVAIVLFAISTVAFRAVHRSADANRMVAHTYQVLNALDRVWTTIVDAEAGVHGFAVTATSEHLEAFTRANRELPAQLDALQALTAERPVQKQHVSALRAAARDTMELLRKSVGHTDDSAASPAYAIDSEKDGMDAVLAIMERMRSEEQRLMAARMQDAATADAQTRAVMNGLILIAFAVLTISFLFTDRRTTQLDRLNASLAERVRERTVELERALTDERRALCDAQQARADADAANRAKDAFIAQASHELRTPLNVLVGWTRMLRDRQLSAPTATRAVTSIDRQGELLKTLVEDLVDLSRITAGRLQLRREEVDVAALAREAMALVEPLASAKTLRIAQNIESRPLLVNGDSTRLRQVVWNLLANAVKFTPAGGVVTLRLGSTGDHAVLHVADDGQGIAPEFLPRVFEPFSQAERHGQGLGLGLAIARQLVTAHGGEIEAASAGVGAGTTFTVRLPLVQQPERV